MKPSMLSKTAVSTNSHGGVNDFPVLYLLSRSIYRALPTTNADNRLCGLRELNPLNWNNVNDVLWLSPHPNFPVEPQGLLL